MKVCLVLAYFAIVGHHATGQAVGADGLRVQDDNGKTLKFATSPSSSEEEENTKVRNLQETRSTEVNSPGINDIGVSKESYFKEVSLNTRRSFCFN